MNELNKLFNCFEAEGFEIEQIGEALEEYFMLEETGQLNGYAD